MATVHQKREAELSITDIKETENEQIGNLTHADATHGILNGEVVKEEPIEIKPLSEESNLSLIYSWETTTSKSIAGDLAKPKVNQINNGDENQPEFIDGLWTNNAELKTENDIDIVYEDVKPVICKEKFSFKNESKPYPNSVPDKLIGMETAPSFSCELSIESGSRIHQNTVIKENETAVKKENDAMIIMNSKDCQMILSEGKLPHCKDEITHRGEKTKCKYCTKSFAEKKSLSEHERNHTRKTLFQCKFCSKSFFRTRDLMEHERIHTGEKPFKCKICPKSFTINKTLVRHEKIHIGEKPFQCKVCPRRFTEKAQLLKHTGIGPFQCQFCAKRFAFKHKLMVHERIHTGEEPFHCKICLKSFKQKNNLNRHMRIHTGEKPFHCKICPKSFAQKSAFKNHETTIHKGENSLQCEFSEKKTLLKRQKIHTGGKSFECRICSKSLATKSNLLAHLRIHTGERPFQCKICPKSFVDKSTLTKHERIHTGEKPYQCKICSKLFNQRAHLMSHERRIHTGEKEICTT